MMIKQVILCVITLFSTSTVRSQGGQSDSFDFYSAYSRIVDSVIKANHGPAYSKVEKFIAVSVTLLSDDELGLDEQELDDYAALRFKNSFAAIKFDRELSESSFVDFPPEEKDAVHGVIMFKVWTVGIDYPIAYHISIMAGTIGPGDSNTDRHTNAYLGNCGKTDVMDIVKECIDSLMEDFAIEFFKARGEL
jgi:hypothetical protein